MTFQNAPGAADEAGLAALSSRIEVLPLPDRLGIVRDAVAGRLVFTTSFGLEDQALTHAIAQSGIEAEILTLDTGRLFDETLEVWAETEFRYGRSIRAVIPEADELEDLLAQDGPLGLRRSVAARKACCDVRKVRPLRRALSGAGGWLTGLRGGQSQARASTPFVEIDAGFGLLKINPLADWSETQLAAYVRVEGIPYNALHDRGFPSIGCAPCTRAVRVGESERAGRWWWETEGKKECGLHGRGVASALSPAPAQAA